MSSPSYADCIDREIVTTRLFDAPRERVFRAWTDPALLARWWGPTGFTNTFETFDPRPGGDWRFVMHGPNGADYANYSVFREITAPARIVFDHVSPPCFRVTAVFDAVGARAKVTFRMLFDDARTCAALKGVVVEANEQNFDRLAALLAQTPA